MDMILTGGRVVDPVSGFDGLADLVLRDGLVADILVHAPASGPPGASASLGGGEAASRSVLDISGLVAAPGLVDLHVHLRQPGQTHKEDIASGTRAAVCGGVTTVLAMPNTKPVVDSPEILRGILESARSTAVVQICQAGAVSVGQQGARLTDFAALQAGGAAALSDDGHPVCDETLMEEAMRRAHALGLLLVDHCEPETEQVLRDIELVRRTGCPVHLAHLSRAASIAAVRAAKRDGLPITAETCPHYFTFTDEAAARLGAQAKMNPPLAREADRQAVIEGLIDGTLDIITTDHAPHHAAEKELPFEQAPNGIVGLETLLSASLSAFCHTGFLTLPALFARLSSKPSDLLRVKCGRIQVGCPADLVIFDPEETRLVHAESFASKGRSTPFEGMALKGVIKYVVKAGKVVVSQGRLVV